MEKHTEAELRQIITEMLADARAEDEREQAAICLAALRGNKDAWEMCLDVIADMEIGDMFRKEGK